MKIAVLLKQVVARQSPLTLLADQTWIDENTAEFDINEADTHALEQALTIKDNHADSEIIVISMGPDRVEKILRDALARGADRAVHIHNDHVPDLIDPLHCAAVFSAMLRAEACDLILTGLQSDDIGMGQTGIILGEMLGMATASLVTTLEWQDASIRVQQELESGWSRWTTMTRPASVTIQTGGKQPRYPNIKGIMSAKKKPITRMEAAEIVTSAPLLQLRRLVRPKRHKTSQMIEGTAEQTVAALVEIINAESKS